MFGNLIKMLTLSLFCSSSVMANTRCRAAEKQGHINIIFTYAGNGFYAPHSLGYYAPPGQFYIPPPAEFYHDKMLARRIEHQHRGF